jgi:hypothetical protein
MFRDAANALDETMSTLDDPNMFDPRRKTIGVLVIAANARSCAEVGTREDGSIRVT